MVQGVHGLFYHRLHLFQVRAVSYAKGYHCQHIAVVLGQVLVILVEQLRVLEGDDFTV